MKNTFLILLAIFGLVITTGCGDDDDNNGGDRNEFVIDGESTELTHGYVEFLGQNFLDSTSFDIDVSLTTENLTFDAEGDFQGSGDIIYLDLNSNTESALVEGTYTFDTERQAFTLLNGILSVGVDATLQTLGTTLMATGGTVEVEVNGTETKFDFSLNMSNGETVTGQFEGALITIF